MSDQKHIVIFSHGFGVRQDARGLFTDIVAALPDVVSVLFDYNTFDDAARTVTVRPLTEQAALLSAKAREVRAQYPEAVIDIICHSQGAVAVALAHLEGVGIRKVIYLAPPETTNPERMLRMFQSRPGTVIDMAGMSRLARRDGSTTLVPSQYFAERKEIELLKLYGQLAERVKLVIVVARQDEILGATDFSSLQKARVTYLDGDHDFTGAYRQGVVTAIANEIL